MKIIKITEIQKIIVIFSICTNLLFSLNAQKAYEFPITPKSEIWRTFTTHEQMINACIIPGDTLKNISTKNLIVCYLNYPLLFDVFAFNNIQQGFNSLHANFNGLQELLMREDAATELIDYYTKFEPSTAQQKGTLIEKGKYSYQISVFELLLAQNEVIKKLTLGQKKQLLSESIRKLKSKQDNKDLYGMQSYNYTAIIMARLLDDEGFEPFMKYKGENAEIESFIETVNCHSADMINGIYNVAIQYINQ